MVSVADLRKKKSELNRLIKEAEKLAGKDAAAYATHVDNMRRRGMAESKLARDIGEIPAIVDPARRASCERNFKLFAETYFPQTFCLPFSADHDRVIAKIELVTLGGGQFAIAMPRGSGKTSLCEAAAIWAVVYGHHSFVSLIGASAPKAQQMLESITTEFETNELLAADFPEICFPILALEGINQRRPLHHGQQITMTLSKSVVVLPDIPGSKAGGAIITVAGLTGSGIRGLKYKRTDGTSVRPGLVIIDDPQTDKSAQSPTQCEKRERLLAGAVLNLAGPGKSLSALMPCTVIAPDDVADRILNKKIHPEWSGDRTKMLVRMAEKGSAAERLVERYREVRNDGFDRDDGGKAGNDFYRTHQSDIEADYEASWPARFKPGEVSATQHAINFLLANRTAFFAEYQNDPLPLDIANAGEQLTKDQIASKLNGLPRGIVPLGCTHLTSFWDVQQSVLYWVVGAFDDKFSGAVIDYGTFPDQHRDYFTLQDVTRTLGRRFPGRGIEGAILAGLEALALELLGREWKREDGTHFRIERCIPDSAWGKSTKTVELFCRTSVYAPILIPSHGWGITASRKPMAEWTIPEGDKRGLNWIVRSAKAGKANRKLTIDTNWWKSFTHERLGVALGDVGCLSLFGRDPQEHRMLADHCVAEYFTRTRNESTGRRTDEWHQRPQKDDNHLWDCLCGTLVAASMQGCSLASIEEEGTAKVYGKKKKKISLSALQGQRRMGR